MRGWPIFINFAVMKTFSAILLSAVLLCSCREGEPPREAFTIETMNKITPVKDQGRSPLCWVYAMLATIESDRLAEGDSVVFEVSVDGGKTFEKIRAVHYQTAKPYPSDIIVSGHPGAEQAILRVRAVSYNPEAWTLTVNSVEVSGIAFCDVPSSLRGDSYNVVGGNVRVTWSPSLNEESEWNLCLARPDGEGGYGEWSQPEVVQGNSE